MNDKQIKNMNGKQIKRQMLGLNPFTNEVLPIEIRIGDRKIRHLAPLNRVYGDKYLKSLSDLLHSIINYYERDINQIDIIEQASILEFPTYDAQPIELDQQIKSEIDSAIEKIRQEQNNK